MGNVVSSTTEKLAGSVARADDKPTYDEWLACSELIFEWADSYDTKDWNRLSTILAPAIKVHYKGVNEFKEDAMPSKSFLGMMSSAGFLGDPLIHTQHFIGASKWKKLGPNLIEGKHQIRAAHQRYVAGSQPIDMSNEGKSEHGIKRDVEAKGHGHAVITITYRCIDGIWKWGGITTDIRWNEFDFEKIFKGFDAPA